MKTFLSMQITLYKTYYWEWFIVSFLALDEAAN